MTNNNGTTSAPAATAVTIAFNAQTITGVTDVMKWNISGNETAGYTFYPNGSTTTWLYATATNNGLRVGDNTNKTFKMATYTNGELFLQHVGTSRYIGVYSSQDWRCYTSINTNISATMTRFYKYVADDSGDSGDGGEDGGEDGGDEPAAGDTYVQTTLAEINANEEVILVWTKNGNSYAISNDNGTSAAPAAVEVTVSGSNVTSSATNIGWNINYDADAETFVIYPAGTTETWLYCTNTNNGVRVGDGNAKTFSINDNYLYEDGTTDARYLGIYNNADIRCYTSINSNITGQTLNFYKKVAGNVSVSAVGYATYYNASSAYVMPEGLEGITMSLNGNALQADHTYAEGDVVPAGEPLLLKGAAKDYILCAGTTSEEKVAGNLLHGNATAGNVAAVAGANLYKLLNGSNGLGWYLGAEDGGVFTLGANKAYLAVPTSAGAPAHFAITDEIDEVTAVENVETVETVKFMENGQLFIKKNGVIYNAMGQVVK